MLCELSCCQPDSHVIGLETTSAVSFYFVTSTASFASRTSDLPPKTDPTDGLGLGFSRSRSDADGNKIELGLEKVIASN